MSADEYLAYLTRFDQHVGQIAVGAYGKWNGRLVRKLSADEFTTKHGEWATLARTYKNIMSRGDTLNDAITKLLRERSAELLLESEPML